MGRGRNGKCGRLNYCGSFDDVRNKNDGSGKV